MIVINVLFADHHFNTGHVGKQPVVYTVLDISKLKKFEDDNFSFDEYDRKFSKMVENTVGSVFQRLVLQTHKNKGLFGKWSRKLPYVEH